MNPYKMPKKKLKTLKSLKTAVEKETGEELEIHQPEEIASLAPIKLNGDEENITKSTAKIDLFCHRFYANGMDCVEALEYVTKQPVKGIAGYRFLRRPEVQAKLHELREAYRNELTVTKAKLIEELEEIKTLSFASNNSQSLKNAIEAIHLQAKMLGHLEAIDLQVGVSVVNIDFGITDMLKGDDSDDVTITEDIDYDTED